MSSPEHSPPAWPLPFEVRIIGSGSRSMRVVLSGELDLASASRLDAALERSFRQADDVVVDLSGVEFIDSSGLSAVVAAVRVAKARGKRLAINSSLSPQVRRLFDLAGVAAALPLVDE